MSEPDIEVTPEETADAAARGAQLVDVREPYEHDAGHIPGTLHIELGALAARVGELDRDRTVVFYCRTGARSLMAAQAFRQAGFDARSMSGGMVQWAGEDRPLEPDGGHVADH